MKAICYSRVLGPRLARTPSGHPIQLGTPVFDTETTSPQAAIAERAAQVHGIVPYVDYWRLISTYDLKPNVRAPYARVYVFEYIPEAGHRQALGIKDSDLDAMKGSWYLQPSTN